MTPRALRRYSRHLLIPEVGVPGQERLGKARVLVIGAGGLGAPVIAYLAAAGVGRIGVVDDDRVDETNLQRQILFASADVGRPKTEVAGEWIRAHNPHVAVDAYPVRLDAANARDLVRPYDVVVDATDAFAARYAINDAARLEGKPVAFGAIFRFDGQVTVFAPGGPCYRCLFPEPPPAGSVPSCAEGGVLGVLAGLVGTWQANEVLKLVLGIGRPLIGRLVLLDAFEGRVREVDLPRDPGCPLCGELPTIRDVAAVTADERPPSNVPGIEATALDAFLATHAEALVLDVREEHEAALGALPAAVSIPASQLESRLHELDSARTYVVACRLGVRSDWAVRRLTEAGFKRLYHLNDGLLGYQAAGAALDLF